MSAETADAGARKRPRSGSSVAASGSRSAQKQRTREHLLDAALNLMEAGRGFSSLSLREVTREAGVVPAAFY
ncbi:MAG TPA: TetR family transcriptional regulator, partial [Wenzhouxiangellaceae bacterium]|nr:TetR family transcriptional regulator [Wenzhouxiangellaceae bacterium]